VQGSLYVYFHFVEGEADDAEMKGRRADFSFGEKFKASGRITQSLAHSHSFEREVPIAAIDAFESGGPFAVELANGNHVRGKVQPTRNALADFRKCIAANKGR
jgi:hypothetical protein